MSKAESCSLKIFDYYSHEIAKNKIFSHSYFTHLKIDMGQSAENQRL